jgi:hypothetical protein
MYFFKVSGVSLKILKKASLLSIDFSGYLGSLKG